MTEQNPAQDPQNEPQEPGEVTDPTKEPQGPQEPQETPQGGQEPDPETFPKEYVQKLRDEAAASRVRAREADELSERLHVELVRATGRLADPTDLAYEAGHLEDVDVLEAAIDDLLARRPHLASRRPTGDVGQGSTSQVGTVDLAGMLRAGA